MKRTVGIAEMATSNDKADILVTYSLGSCIGLTVYDRQACVGGLIHCMLPDCEVDPVRAETSPCMFVDRGVPALLEALIGMGASTERLVARVAGASSFLSGNGLFKICDRNHAVLRKILSERGVSIAAEDVGGTATRTLSLSMTTGQTTVRSRAGEVVL